MSLAVVFSRAHTGIEATLVTVEVHLSGGLPGFSIVGLAETAVKEAKDRVRSALLTLKLRVSETAHHRQPGSRRAAQARRAIRSADCSGNPRRIRPD